MTDISRRNLAKGAAWAVPVVAATSMIPAYAASRVTATVTPQMWQTRYARLPTSCSPTTNPIKGYLDTLPCNSPAYDYVNGVKGASNSDCKQDPTTSDGFWLESTTAGTAIINSISVTYTFSTAVIFDGTTYATGNANSTGGSRWNSNDILMAGWSITSKSSTSITLTYSGSGVIDASTAVAGSGFATGYFINFRVSSTCTSTVTVTTAVTMNYTDATGANKTWTKNTSSNVIQP